MNTNEIFIDEKLSYDIKMLFADELVKGVDTETALKNAKKRSDVDRVAQDAMGIYGNIWFRNLHMNKGERIKQHLHTHPHVTLIGQGSVKAEIEGLEPRIYYAGEVVPVPPNRLHSFVGLEDGTEAFCTYAVRDEDGEMVDWEDCLKIMRPRAVNSPDIKNNNLFKPEVK